MITKPILAHTVKKFDDLKFPVIASPKLDGIRALRPSADHGLVSRTFKPIPNDFVRGVVERFMPVGVDGELVARDPDGNDLAFNECTSAFMDSKRQAQPNFVYYIFDFIHGDLKKPFEDRLRDLEALIDVTDFDGYKGYFEIVPQKVIGSYEELVAYEEEMVEAGYEGVMVRDPKGPYKCGRSTERSGILGKIKRFKDDEAVVVGFEELMHNANEAKKDAFGRTERSTCKENLVPMGTLGKLVVEKDGIQFRIGTGYDQATRQEIWDNRDRYQGALVKFKYQPHGVVDGVPRFPVFLGFRSGEDV